MKEPVINEEDIDGVASDHEEDAGSGDPMGTGADGAPHSDVAGRRGSEGPGAADGGSSDGRSAEDELAAMSDRHLRLVAEFNNFRRRTEQERLGAWSRAQADLVGKFIEVIDDVQRVANLDLSNATVDAIMEGIDLVERKFIRVLEDAGVDLVDPSGQAFDPEVMEAMMRVPAESDEQVDMVAQVFQKGYSLKGILIRPARVSVFTQG
jgi:molecular chaperone GrpE